MTVEEYIIRQTIQTAIQNDGESTRRNIVNRLLAQKQNSAADVYLANLDWSDLDDLVILDEEQVPA